MPVINTMLVFVYDKCCDADIFDVFRIVLSAHRTFWRNIFSKHFVEHDIGASTLYEDLTWLYWNGIRQEQDAKFVLNRSIS